ncbi:Uncharacterised protein [uncultured archaeon]|nr:Uncharacterised protein [uncultured archaeon]
MVDDTSGTVTVPKPSATRSLATDLMGLLRTAGTSARVMAAEFNFRVGARSREEDVESTIAAIERDESGSAESALYGRLASSMKACPIEVAKRIIDFTIDDSPSRLGVLCCTASAEVAGYALDAAKNDSMNPDALMSLTVSGNRNVAEAAADAMLASGYFINYYKAASEASDRLPDAERNGLRRHMREMLKNVKTEDLSEFMENKIDDVEAQMTYAFIARHSTAKTRREAVKTACEYVSTLREDGMPVVKCADLLVVMCDMGSKSMRDQVLEHLAHMKPSEEATAEIAACADAIMNYAGVAPTSGLQQTPEDVAAAAEMYAEEYADLDALVYIGERGNRHTAAAVKQVMDDLGEQDVWKKVEARRSAMVKGDSRKPAATPAR